MDAGEIAGLLLAGAGVAAYAALLARLLYTAPCAPGRTSTRLRAVLPCSGRSAVNPTAVFPSNSLKFPAFFTF
jgi:hypothetical protein